MRISKPIKILIGLLTAGVLILPVIIFLSMQVTTFKTLALFDSLAPSYNFLLVITRLILFIPICWFFLLIGLGIFYLIHIYANKSGNVFIRVLFAVGMFILPFFVMVVYYFVYILPENPSAWALAPDGAIPQHYVF